MNGVMGLAEGAPNHVQRLPRFPPAPQLGPLRRRKRHPFPLGHTHHLEQKFYTRWCCIAEGPAPGQARLNAGDGGAADVGEGGVGEPSAQLLNTAAIRVSVSSTN